MQIEANYLYLLAQFLNRATNRRTDEYGGGIEGRARILFEVVEAILEEVDAARVGVKIAPMHETGPFAANEETLPVVEYAIRELSGYGLSHLLLMGNTTDFTGTPLEPLMGDAMFHHFRPIFRGTLIANVQMDAKRANRLIREGVADLYRVRPAVHRQSRPGRAPEDRGAVRRNRLVHRLRIRPQGLFRLPGTRAGNDLIQRNRRLPWLRLRRYLTDSWRPLVLEAFDTLFNQLNFAAAERFWSEHYVQHSAHIPPGRNGLFDLVRTLPDTLKYENQLVVAEGDLVVPARSLFRPW